MIHLMCSDPASSISGTYILNGIYALAFTPGVSNFFFSQIVNIFSFSGLTVSVTTIQLCVWNAAMDYMTTNG